MEELGAALTSSLPQRLVAGFTDSWNSDGGASFFDKLDDTDADDDPILKQVELNKIQPRQGPMKPRVPILALPVATTSYGWDFNLSVIEDNKGHESDIEISRLRSNSAGSVSEKASIKCFLAFLLNSLVTVTIYLRFAASTSWPWIKAFCIVSYRMITNIEGERRIMMSDQLDESSNTSTFHANPQRLKEHRCRVFLYNSFEFVSSPLGMSVVTGLLLVLSYYRFRRYGTDAGD